MKKIRFVDCGANVGQSVEWALDAFKNCELKIDSFEPLPKNVEVLREKFGNNPHVSIHDAAVSTTDGLTSFYCQNWGARTGSSLVKGKSSASDMDVINVRTIDIAKWLRDNVNEDEVCVLKVDIEGAEYEVLPHLIDQGLNSVAEFLLVEYHGTKTPNYSPSVEILTSNSFAHVVDWGKPELAKNVLIKFGLIE